MQPKMPRLDSLWVTLKRNFSEISSQEDLGPKDEQPTKERFHKELTEGLTRLMTTPTQPGCHGEQIIHSYWQTRSLPWHGWQVPPEDRKTWRLQWLNERTLEGRDIGMSLRHSYGGEYPQYSIKHGKQGRRLTTKLHIVYDCSAKANDHTPSLNDCLEVGPPIQPMMFDILLCNRKKKLCLTGNIQKEFLQIKFDVRERCDEIVLVW